MINIPQDFKDRMKSALRDEYNDFLECYNHPPYNGFRANTLKISPDELLQLFPYSSGSVPWCDSGFYYSGGFGKHPCHKAGLFYSQEPSAMISAELLNIKDGDVVLDLCAAPGGKSTHIAAKLRGTGLLVCNEIIHSRAAVLRENIERMGISNAVVTNMSPDDMSSEFVGFFDKILVDAPCSGEGMFRKEDAAVTAWSIEHTISCSIRQNLILESASKMLRHGGVLVYSTCTFSPLENDNLIKSFLNNHSEFSLEHMEYIYPHKAKGEGHFAAKLLKSGNSARANRKSLLASADDSLFRNFEHDNLKTKLMGIPLLFGDNLYLLPSLFGDIKGIKIILPGLHLGEIKKNRFEPAYHLAMALTEQDFNITHHCTEDELNSYFQGDVINASHPNGWGVMLYNKYPVGWFKSVNGQLKNHYPKKLRNQ